MRQPKNGKEALFELRSRDTTDSKIRTTKAPVTCPKEKEKGLSFRLSTYAVQVRGQGFRLNRAKVSGTPQKHSTYRIVHA